MSRIPLTPIQSSMFSGVGYDSEDRTLRLRMMNGAVYDYLDVPKRFYEQLCQAASAGRYYGTHIKGVFDCARVPWCMNGCSDAAGERDGKPLCEACLKGSK